MNKKDQDEKKELILKNRAKGAGKVSSAILSGIGVKTLYVWLEADENFDNDFKAAWHKYQMSLIKTTKRRNSKYLLQNDFSKRFKPENSQENTLNIFGNINIANIKGLDDKSLDSEIERIGREKASVTAREVNSKSQG